MNKKNSIVVISSNIVFGEALSEMIILLRKSDKVVWCNFDNAHETISEAGASVALLEVDNREKTLELISKLRESVQIILLTNNNDIVLDAYDAGITDFCSVDAEDYELVIRVVNCIKTALIRQNFTRNRKLLMQNSIIDEETGFYSYNSGEQVISNEITTSGLNCGTFIVVAPAEECKSVFAGDLFASAIKQSVRQNDIVTLGKGARVYILLPYTDTQGAVAVVDKIRQACSDDFEVKAGICDIENKDFVQLELLGLKALQDAMYSDNYYTFATVLPEQTEDWLGVENATINNYKLFRNIYKKKLDRVIIPVFYRMQKAYEEKFMDTEIFQFAEDERCIFQLKNRNHESVLKILYPGFAKVVVSVTHQGLDTPENRDVSLLLSRLNIKELTRLMEEFISEFETVCVN